MLPPIRSEQATDHAAIAAVHRAAFGRDAEAMLVAMLRREASVLASLVALHDETIVGHVMFSALRVDVSGRDVPTAGLAPLAVVPNFRRRGHGTALVRAGIEALRAEACAAIIVLGDPAYYGRFGFSAALTRHLEAPFRGPAFMGLELSPGALAGPTGSVSYPAPFRVVK